VAGETVVEEHCAALGGAFWCALEPDQGGNACNFVDHLAHFVHSFTSHLASFDLCRLHRQRVIGSHRDMPSKDRGELLGLGPAPRHTSSTWQQFLSSKPPASWSQPGRRPSA